MSRCRPRRDEPGLVPAAPPRKAIGLLALIACTLLTACRAAGNAETDAAGEEAEVLDAVERFFAAIGARDTAAYRAQVVPEAMTFSVAVTPSGAEPVRILSHTDHMAMLAGATQRFHERMWDPTVKVRGPIALVWAPYEFTVDGRFAHCGIDSLELIQVDGIWRVANAAWTVEREDCGPEPAMHTETADADRAAVLDVVQRMLDAMTVRDTAAYAATLMREATYFRIRVNEDGTTEERMRTGAEDIAALASGSQKYVERLREPEVLLHPPLAVVWSPYDFHIDGAFAHCGVDIFQLMKIAGEWKLTTATWTVETAVCTSVASTSGAGE